LPTTLFSALSHGICFKIHKPSGFSTSPIAATTALPPRIVSAEPEVTDWQGMMDKGRRMGWLVFSEGSVSVTVIWIGRDGFGMEGRHRRFVLLTAISLLSLTKGRDIGSMALAAKEH
jgi:hypothetical protein